MKKITPMFKGNISKFFHTWGRLYVVTLLFVTFAAFLFWLDFFRTYEAEVNILVIGKTPTTSTEQVVENFAELTRNLSFYEKVVAGNDLLDDDFEGYTKDKRKTLWNKTLSAERTKNSGMLTLRVQKERAEIAKLLAEQTTKELFAVAGFYYNVKTDIDMRVVDGPIVKTTLARPVHYTMVSIGTGILLTTIFFWLLQAFPFFLGKRKVAQSIPRSSEEKGSGEKAYPHFNIGDSVPLIDPKKFIPSRPASLSFETPSQEEREEEKNIREEILFSQTQTSQASAPLTAPQERNLPVATEELPFQFEEVEDESGEEGSLETNTPPEEEKKLPEPTVDEYKRRLNELLRGGK